jgi:delta 1-pyrroline-5-carboxylate dehydrogenase
VRRHGLLTETDALAEYPCPDQAGDASVTPELIMAREAIFGPVASLLRFETEQEAIRMANATEFGLAAYFHTRDLARSWRVAAALANGMAGLNTGLLSTATAPFGGVKESGIGREGSRHGILQYTELKSVRISAPPASRSSASRAIELPLGAPVSRLSSPARRKRSP